MTISILVWCLLQQTPISWIFHDLSSVHTIEILIEFQSNRIKIYALVTGYFYDMFSNLYKSFFLLCLVKNPSFEDEQN
jgi:hypothetical protein